MAGVISSTSFSSSLLFEAAGDATAYAIRHYGSGVLGTFAPGGKSSRERKFQVLRSESSCYRADKLVVASVDE